MLNKEICKVCNKEMANRKASAFRNPRALGLYIWGQEDDEQWERGWVRCQRSKAIWKSEDNRGSAPDWCPYYLEHEISNAK